MFETGNLGDVEEKYYSVTSSFHYPDHLFFFSEENLENLLEITGFELIAMHRYSILYQLKIIRLLRKIIRLLQKISDPFGIRLSKNILPFFRHLLRYKIGYILPKKGKPQTVIVVAKKPRKRSKSS